MSPRMKVDTDLTLILGMGGNFENLVDKQLMVRFQVLRQIL